MSAELQDKATRPVDTVEIEVDGVRLEAPKGAMLIEVTDRAGIDIPRFCYHKKLSIAANCRMCLVDVEKAPKPLPACATPVTDGMKVYTESRRAIDAQHGVMEFLLINHPLDCPICDQGGECELQDLAMGYGRSVSRFTERKRVIKDKYLGPLVHSDMTRCIHCTRCVRFLEEIAGTCEMGGAGRGDRTEIGTIVQSSIDSELSGNIIDLCPVGALTNKPFRYRARAWELKASASVACHDGVGSLLYHHALRGQILRSVPKDNETTNETWLADRDRYSVHGLYADDRVLTPRLRQDGEWRDASWDEAMAAAAAALKAHAPRLGMLMSPSAATEEYYLAQKLVRGLGSDNIDHRLREADFRDDAVRSANAAFEMPIAGMEAADAVLLVGSNIRHEAPILGHRLRKAWHAGAAIAVVNPLDWDFTFEPATRIISAPQHLVAALAGIAAALEPGDSAKPSESVAGLIAGANPNQAQQRIAESLAQGENALVLVGQAAMSHGAAAVLRQLATYIAKASGAALNLLPHGANTVGAWRAGAVPHRAAGIGTAGQEGLGAAAMLVEKLPAYLLWGLEPEFDIENPSRAVSALKDAEVVVAIADFASGALNEMADIILPLAPIAESEGSFLNLDGGEFAFSPAGRPSGDTRPGWKILRRLGAELGLEGFGQVSLGEVQEEMRKAVATTNAGSEAQLGPLKLEPDEPVAGLHRVGEVPAYSPDALCRRSEPLQKTVQADSYFVALHPEDAAELGLDEGASARVSQPDSGLDDGGESVDFPLRISDKVPAGAVWLRCATCSTCRLGAAFGRITVEKGAEKS